MGRVRAGRQIGHVIYGPAGATDTGFFLDWRQLYLLMVIGAWRGFKQIKQVFQEQLTNSIFKITTYLSGFEICLSLVSTSFCVFILIITTCSCLLFNVFTRRVLFPVFCSLCSWCVFFFSSCFILLSGFWCLVSSFTSCLWLSAPVHLCPMASGFPVCQYKSRCSPLSGFIFMMSCPALLSRTHVCFPRVFSVQDLISLKENYF